MVFIPITAAPTAYGLGFAFVLLSLLGAAFPRLYRLLMMDMRAVRQYGSYHRWVTSAFLHAGPWHLAINMIVYFFFAPIVELLVSPPGFLLICVVAQLAAMVFVSMRHFRSPNYRAVGASAIISALVVAYAVILPYQDVLLFFVVRVPAIVAAVLYILYSAFAMRGSGRVGHDAHLAGALTGGALAYLLPVNPGVVALM